MNKEAIEEPHDSAKGEEEGEPEWHEFHALCPYNGPLYKTKIFLKKQFP